MLLENKVALITGCGQGIGRAMAEVFAREGATVYAVARREGCIDRAAEELSAASAGAVVPLYFDVRDKDAIKQSVMRIKKEQGRLDVLVNNAGVMKDALVEMVSDQTVAETFETNVFAPIHMTQMALRLMKRQKSGSIINMTSIVGLRGSAGQTVYAASKGAVANLTKTWARELVADGIRVNGIAPGKIDTAMYRSIGEQRVAEGIGEVGMGRLGRPEEVANVALFLASDLASYVTGEIVSVNGGWFL